MARKKTAFQWARDDQPDQVAPRVHRRNRTVIRAENRALDDLALRLAALTPGQRAPLQLDPHLNEEVELLARLGRKTAHRRQLIRVQGLLRLQDIEAIQAALDGDTTQQALTVALERWRSDLLDGGDDQLQAFVDAYPLADRQQLRSLIRSAAEQDGAKDSTREAARRLYQALKAAAQTSEAAAGPSDAAQTASDAVAEDTTDPVEPS